MLNKKDLIKIRDILLELSGSDESLTFKEDYFDLDEDNDDHVERLEEIDDEMERRILEAFPELKLPKGYKK